RPPPMQAPSMSATVGQGRASIRPMTSRPWRIKARTVVGSFEALPSSRRSAPAMNMPGLPLRRIRPFRSLRASNSLSNASHSATTARPNVLARLPGRSKVMIPMPSAPVCNCRAWVMVSPPGCKNRCQFTEKHRACLRLPAKHVKKMNRVSALRQTRGSLQGLPWLNELLIGGARRLAFLDPGKRLSHFRRLGTNLPAEDALEHGAVDLLDLDHRVGGHELVCHAEIIQPDPAAAPICQLAGAGLIGGRFLFGAKCHVRAVDRRRRQL